MCEHLLLLLLTTPLPTSQARAVPSEPTAVGPSALVPRGVGAGHRPGLPLLLLHPVEEGSVLGSACRRLSPASVLTSCVMVGGAHGPSVPLCPHASNGCHVTVLIPPKCTGVCEQVTRSNPTKMPASSSSPSAGPSVQEGKSS